MKRLLTKCPIREAWKPAILSHAAISLPWTAVPYTPSMLLNDVLIKRHLIMPRQKLRYFSHSTNMY